VFLLALFGSPAEIPSDLIDHCLPHLYALVDPTYPYLYRLLLIFYEIEVPEPELRRIVDSVLDCRQDYVMEIISHLISRLNSKGVYFGWLCQAIEGQSFQVACSAVRCIFRHWTDFEPEKQSQFAEFVRCGIRGFPFSTQQALIQYIGCLPDIDLFVNPILFEKMIDFCAMETDRVRSIVSICRFWCAAEADYELQCCFAELFLKNRASLFHCVLNKGFAVDQNPDGVVRQPRISNPWEPVPENSHQLPNRGFEKLEHAEMILYWLDGEMERFKRLLLE
jgi:hypothetical protein